MRVVPIMTVLTTLSLTLSMGCGGKEGLCIYIENDTGAPWIGSEVCTDGLGKRDCKAVEGEFTKGGIGDAADNCQGAGFSEECGAGLAEGSTLWAPNGRCGEVTTTTTTATTTTGS